MSVSLLVGLLTYLNLANIGCSLVLDDISFWTFWRLSWDISGLFPIFFKFPVCLSVCQLAYFLAEIIPIYGHLLFWWVIFWTFLVQIPEMLVHYFQIILNFLYVCQSVSLITSFLKLDKYKYISSSGWDIFLNFLETLLRCWYTSSKLFWISCMSVSLFYGWLLS